MHTMTTHTGGETMAQGSSLTMFTTTWCGYCQRLKKQMEREGIDFGEVDIEQDDGAADLVMKVNGGNQTVPTLLFPDGSALTNPTVDQIREKLAS
jgi:mycoredoxin